MKVSVIIPTYNRATLVVESLKSVLTQCFRDFEVIVVDDGSTDNTEEALKPYLGRIRYVKQRNQGASAARNTGIRAAKGELIAFNDSDDLWFSDKLEKQVRYLDEHPDVAMSVGNGVFFGNPKIEGKKVIPDKRAVPLENDGVIIHALFMKSCIRTSTMVTRRHVVDDLQGFDQEFKVCEDLDFVFRVLARKYKVAFINDSLFRLRKHPFHLGDDSETRTLFNIKAIEKLLRDYPETRDRIGRANVNRRLAYRYYRLARIYGKKSKKAESLEALKMALSYRPLYPSCVIHYLLCHVCSLIWGSPYVLI